MRNFVALEEKGSVREFIANDLSNAGLRIDTNKHRNNINNQPSPAITSNPKQQSRVFNVPLHQMDAISIKVDNLDLTVPIFLRWCFDCIRRSIKHEGLFRKSGGSQRIKELMIRIEDGPLTPNLSPSNTVFDICSLFKEFLRRLTYPLITYPLQDLLLDCFSMRSLSSDKKVDIYLNILLLLPDEHLHALIYILRFLHEITLNERDNKMNAKNLAICVGPGIMRTAVEGKANLMTEQCATSVSDIVEALIINATKLGYVADSVYERSQMLLEMRQKEAAQNTDESFAIENGIENGIGGGKINDPANAKKRRSGSVKEFLVHMTNRLRRRSGSNNDSRDQTHVFLDQSGKLSSSHTREHRYHYQQNSISGHCLSSSSSSTTTTKRKSSDDPNGGNSKRGKTKTTEKSSLPDTNRFTSPITAFRRKKKTPGSINDPGFPFKIEHSHLPQLLHFTDEVPLRFTNAVVNAASSVSSSTSSSSTTTPSGSMTTLAASIANNGSIVLGALQPSAMIPSETQSSLSSTAGPAACINKSLDAKKLNLLDSWKWPKSSRKAERKPLVAIHAPMLLTSTVGSLSLAQSPPSPIKPANGSNQSSCQQMAGTSLLMHSSFGVARRHSDDVVSTSLSTTAYRPRRSISSSGGQQQTRHVVCMSNNYSHSLPSNQQQDASDDDDDDDHEPEQDTRNGQSMPNNLNSSQESYDDDEEISNELNLAVVVGNEDMQSLRAFPNEPAPTQGSLDVAFIDEADLERQKAASEIEQRDHSTVMDTVTNDTDTLSQTVAVHGEQHSIEMQEVTSSNDLDEILKRNESRGIRLTDSDDEEHVNFSLSMNRTTPPTVKKDELKSTTPKMPVRLSSSISNLISTSSLTTICKERSLSCSLSQATNELFHSKSHVENDENIGILNGGRESILQLKGELAGRVLRQVRAFEQRSSENIQNRSIANDLFLLAHQKTNANTKPSSPILSTLSSLTIMNTPEQNLIEQALRQSKKIVSSSSGTGEVTRSVKRLQNTPIRRWKERAREFERRHQLTPPYRLLNKKRK